MSIGQPPPSAPEDGVSQEDSGVATKVGETAGRKVAKDGTIGLAGGRRAKRARVKRSIRGSGLRANRHRLEKVKLTKEGLSPDDLSELLQQRKGDRRDVGTRELEKLLEGREEESKAREAEKEATEQQRSVMTTVVPIHGNWKPHIKEEDDITFLSVNLGILA